MIGVQGDRGLARSVIDHHVDRAGKYHDELAAHRVERPALADSSERPKPDHRTVESRTGDRFVAPEMSYLITNAIESLNARMRRATRARGHFPNEQAAVKCLYLDDPLTGSHRAAACGAG